MAWVVRSIKFLLLVVKYLEVIHVSWLKEIEKDTLNISN